MIFFLITVPFQLTVNKVIIAVKIQHLKHYLLPAWLSTWRMFAETSYCQMWLLKGSFLQVSHFKKWQRFVHKLNVELPYDPAIPHLGIYQKEVKTCTKKKHTHTTKKTSIHEGLQQHYSQQSKVERAQMSISRWKDKQNVVHLYNGVLLGHKKGWSTSTCYNKDEPWKHYA